MPWFLIPAFRSARRGCIGIHSLRPGAFFAGLITPNGPRRSLAEARAP